MADTVHAALAAVMAELPNIGKADKSPEGYIYRGIESVTRHVQPLFAKHGVVISPEATVTGIVPSPAMKDGWTDVHMTVRWTITGPDGSTIIAQTNGIGRDRADKGANKAQTQAFKYLLLHLLCIADGKDDTDGATYEEHRQRPQPGRPVPKPAGDAQHRRLFAALRDAGVMSRTERLAVCSDIIGREISSSNDLTRDEIGRIIDQLSGDSASSDGAVESGTPPPSGVPAPASYPAGEEPFEAH